MKKKKNIEYIFRYIYFVVGLKSISLVGQMLLKLFYTNKYLNKSLVMILLINII